MLQEFKKLCLNTFGGKGVKERYLSVPLTCAAARFSASSFLLVAGKNTMLSIVWMSSSCTTHLIKRAANNFCSGNSLKERKLLVNWRTFLSCFEGMLKNSLTSSTCVKQTGNPPAGIPNTRRDHHVTNWNFLKTCFLKLSVIHCISLV